MDKRMEGENYSGWVGGSDMRWVVGATKRERPMDRERARG